MHQRWLFSVKVHFISFVNNGADCNDILLSEVILNVFNDKTPIKRQDPKPGESQYYRINPGQGNVPFSELKTTDIPEEQPLFNTGQGLRQNHRL